MKEERKIFLEIGERIGGTNPSGFGIASKLVFGRLGG